MTRLSAVASTSAVRVRVPFRRPFVSARGTFRERDAWIVRVRDADGLEGVGEASLDPAAGPRELESLAMAVRAAVASRPAAVRPDSDAVSRAVGAAFAGAIGDLALHHTPIARGYVHVNATIATEELEATLDQTEAALEAGFDCLKLKGGREHATESLVERLSLVRALAGGDIELRLDVNGAWDRATAAERLGSIGHLGLSYVEQPIAPGDMETLAWLRRVGPVDLAADESVGSPADAAALVEADAVDVLVVKPARVGGAEEARRIAGIARPARVGITVSTALETGVGLAASIRLAANLRGVDAAWAHGLATSGLLESDLLAEPLEAHDGRVAVPTGPLVLDEAAVARYTVDRVEAP